MPEDEDAIDAAAEIERAEYRDDCELETLRAWKSRAARMLMDYRCVLTGLAAGAHPMPSADRIALAELDDLIDGRPAGDVGERKPSRKLVDILGHDAEQHRALIEAKHRAWMADCDIAEKAGADSGPPYEFQGAVPRSAADVIDDAIERLQQGIDMSRKPHYTFPVGIKNITPSDLGHDANGSPVEDDGGMQSAEWAAIAGVLVVALVVLVLWAVPWLRREYAQLQADITGTQAVTTEERR